MIGWILILVVIGFAAYVRLAPHDKERWHKQAYPSGLGDRASKGGFVWREEVSDDGLEKLRKLDDVIRATERTTKIAGAIEDGQVTYVTRSKLWGFPDYTTIGLYQGLVEDADVRFIEINSRLRFGRSDLGVNRKRVKGWLAAL